MIHGMLMTTTASSRGPPPTVRSSASTSSPTGTTAGAAPNTETCAWSKRRGANETEHITIEFKRKKWTNEGRGRAGKNNGTNEKKERGGNNERRKERKRRRKEGQRRKGQAIERDMVHNERQRKNGSEKSKFQSHGAYKIRNLRLTLSHSLLVLWVKSLEHGSVFKHIRKNKEADFATTNINVF